MQNPLGKGQKKNAFQSFGINLTATNMLLLNLIKSLEENLKWMKTIHFLSCYLRVNYFYDTNMETRTVWHDNFFLQLIRHLNLERDYLSQTLDYINKKTKNMVEVPGWKGRREATICISSELSYCKRLRKFFLGATFLIKAIATQID